MKIDYQVEFGRIRIKPGEKIVSVTTYHDHLIVITDWGTIYRVVLADL